MNPSRTLADRFRTQRTERIRVDGNEILSVHEIELHAGDLVEIVVEDGRTTTAQGFALDADLPLDIITSPESAPVPVTGSRTSVDTLSIDAVEAWITDAADATDPVRIRVWNTWRVDGSDQAWTGNAGMVLEDLEVPDGARSRVRLWCSDGLGNATFDDLVLVVTVGPRPSDPTS